MEAVDNQILAILCNVEVFTGQVKGDEICNYLWMVPPYLLFISMFYFSKGCMNYTHIAIDARVSFHMIHIS